MRPVFALPLPLLALAACNVDNDSGNDQLRVEYNQQRIEGAAAAAADVAGDVASSAGNVAVTTGRAIKNEVGDVDVDVDVSRNRAETTNSQ
jgi:hypothetical protein